MMLYGNTESAPDQLHLGRLSFVIEEPCRSHPNPYCMSHLRMSGRVWLVILSEAKDLLIQPGQILRRSLLRMTADTDYSERFLGTRWRGGEAPQGFHAAGDGVFGDREGEAQVALSFGTEDETGDGGDAGGIEQEARGGSGVRAERVRDPREEIECGRRGVDLETGGAQAGDERVPPSAIARLRFMQEGVRQAQRLQRSPLRRRRDAVDRVEDDRLHRHTPAFGDEDIARAPAGHGVRLGQREDGDRPLEHPRERSGGDMSLTVVDQVLVGFVGDHREALFADEGAYLGDLRSRED